MSYWKNKHTEQDERPPWRNLSFRNHRQKWEGLSNALRCPTAVLAVKVRSAEGRGRGVKAEIISDSVINGLGKVAVFCFSSDSDTGTWRGQQSGRGARKGRIVTAVRIRQSDCRHSKQDVTYPSAGILLLPFSSRPRRGGKKEKKIIQKYLLRSFLKSIRHPTRRSWCQ